MQDRQFHACRKKSQRWQRSISRDTKKRDNLRIERPVDSELFSGYGRNWQFKAHRQSLESPNKHWNKEIADLNITLPSEYRLIKDGLQMNMAIRGARATNTVINTTMFCSWHSIKMPNLSGLCILICGMYDPEISGTNSIKNFRKPLNEIYHIRMQTETVNIWQWAK
jgi:hypothetical protein